MANHDLSGIFHRTPLERSLVPNGGDDILGLNYRQEERWNRRNDAAAIPIPSVYSMRSYVADALPKQIQD